MSQRNSVLNNPEMDRITFLSSPFEYCEKKKILPECEHKNYIFFVYTEVTNYNEHLPNNVFDRHPLAFKTDSV